VVSAEAEIRDALADASVPALLMCLYHFSGDERWLDDPFRPRRDTSMFADEGGGLGDDAQRQVRDAALDLLSQRRDDHPVPPVPDEATFLRMMRTFLGEEVPPEYA